MIAPTFNFAATITKGRLTPPWPISPVLDLPGGSLQVNGGTLVTYQRWIIAVALSPKHILVAQRVPSREKCEALLEQAVGFWHARDVKIVRVPIRCENDWFRTMPTGALEVRKCIIFWVRRFFSNMPSQWPELPNHIWPLISLRDIVMSGHRLWIDAGHVLEGLEAHDSDLIYDVSAIVAAQARKWEYYVARWLHRIEQCYPFSDLDQEFIARVDRCFISVVSRFLPGVDALPSTIARLL